MRVFVLLIYWACIVNAAVCWLLGAVMFYVGAAWPFWLSALGAPIWYTAGKLFRDEHMPQRKAR